MRMVYQNPFFYDVKNKKDLVITEFDSINNIAQKSYDELNQKLGDMFFKEGVDPKLAGHISEFTNQEQIRLPTWYENN